MHVKIDRYPKSSIPFLELTASKENKMMYFLHEKELYSHAIFLINSKKAYWVDGNSGRAILRITGLRPVVAFSRSLSHSLIKDFSSKDELDSRINAYTLAKSPLSILKPQFSSNLTFLGSMKRGSAHKVAQCMKVGNTSNALYFFKENNSAGSAIPEIEAFNALCFRVLLGKSAAKVSCVYDTAFVRIGSISKAFPGFISVKDYYKDNLCDVVEMANAGAGKIFMAALLEDENDLHRGNYGFVNGQLVKIDHDQATASIAVKYNVCMQGKTFNFTLTSSDILTLPILKDAKPRNWATRCRGEEYPQSKIDSKGLSEHPQFQQDKFYIGLKRLLIADSVYTYFAAITIRSKKLRAQLVTEKANKTKALEAVLMGMPEFREYVENNPEAIDNILSELKAFKHGMDMDVIKTRYFALFPDMGLCNNNSNAF